MLCSPPIPWFSFRHLFYLTFTLLSPYIPSQLLSFPYLLFPFLPPLFHHFIPFFNHLHSFLFWLPPNSPSRSLSFIFIIPLTSFLFSYLPIVPSSTPLSLLSPSLSFPLSLDHLCLFSYFLPLFFLFPSLFLFTTLTGSSRRCLGRPVARSVFCMTWERRWPLWILWWPLLTWQRWGLG